METSLILDSQFSPLLFLFGFLWCCRKQKREKYIFIKDMVLIPIHEGCAKTVCLINCNYFVYSSILLSMCPCPKLARVSDFHLARILWQSQNYDGNKYMYYEKKKIKLSLLMALIPCLQRTIKCLCIYYRWGVPLFGADIKFLRGADTWRVCRGARPSMSLLCWPSCGQIPARQTHFNALCSAIPQLFLSTVQDLTGYLYIHGKQASSYFRTGKYVWEAT